MKKICFLLYLYTLVPVATVEIFSQFRFKTGYIYNTANGIDPKDQKEAGLHSPNMYGIYQYRTIYGDPTKIKNVLFRTDKYGTIEPSTLSSSQTSIKDSILFCGGSTTECLSVHEGQRVPDVFQRLTNINAINAGKSSKDLRGCINTLKYVFEKFGKPKSIVISNNVNTLMNFPKERDKIPQNQIRQKLTTFDQLKKTTRTLIPGIYQGLHLIKKTISQERNILNSNDQTKLTLYETSLSQGCCHGAGNFNRSKKSIKFKWRSEANQEDYYRYVQSLGEKLDQTLNSYNYPKSNIYIFIEPNSYGNKKTSGSTDYRQFLHDENGRQLSASESSNLTTSFDNSYSNALKDQGFKIIQVPKSELKSNHFYDAAHLSPEGAYMIGKFYSRVIQLKD